MNLPIRSLLASLTAVSLALTVVAPSASAAEAAATAKAAAESSADADKPDLPASLAGKYALDKKSFIEQARAAIAKMPKEQQALAEAALAAMPTIELTVTLAKSGKATVVLDQPAPPDGNGAAVHKVREARWRRLGGDVVVSDGTEKDLKCRPVDEGLVCAQGLVDILLRRQK